MRTKKAKKEIVFALSMSTLFLSTLGFSAFIMKTPTPIKSDINVNFGELNTVNWFKIELNSIFKICKDGFVENEEIVDNGFINIDISLDCEKAKQSSYVDSQGNLTMVTLLNYKSNQALLDAKTLNQIYYTLDGNDTDIVSTSEFVSDGLKNRITLNILDLTKANFLLHYGFIGNIYEALMRNTVQFSFMIGVEQG